MLFAHLAGSKVRMETGFAIYPFLEGKLAKLCGWGLRSQYSRGKHRYNLLGQEELHFPLTSQHPVL